MCSNATTAAAASSSSSSLTGGSAARLLGLHVALHAQVAPASGFVVGSVMTTMGLRAALLRLPAVASVEVFFPFDYGTESGRAATMFDRQWDLVTIEGWFPSINSFIHEIRRISEPSWGHAAAVAAWGDDDEGDKRNNNYDAHGNLVDEAGEAASLRSLRLSSELAQSEGFLRRHGPVVLFWCLDPSFPGLQQLALMDVDGFHSQRGAAELRSLTNGRTPWRTCHSLPTRAARPHHRHHRHHH